MQVLDQAMEEARQLVGRLRGSPADGRGLVDAVQRLIGESHWSNRLTVRFDHHVAEGALAPNEQDAAFRIIQESLNNAARHSQSEEARVRATVDCGVLRILVEDDGVGFDPWQVSGDHYGIEGMRLRAALLGGWLTVDSFAGHGTQVTAEIPLKKLGS
jgi:two-component system sensor histidine kinase DegS